MRRPASRPFLGIVRSGVTLALPVCEVTLLRRLLLPGDGGDGGSPERGISFPQKNIQNRSRLLINFTYYFHTFDQVLTRFRKAIVFSSVFSLPGSLIRMCQDPEQSSWTLISLEASATSLRDPSGSTMVSPSL